MACRLSEPNMASISGQLEELYMAHSRKDMNGVLTDVLLSACAPGTAMPSRLVMEHVLLVSILHHTVGTEVGLPSPRLLGSALLWARGLFALILLRPHRVILAHIQGP